MSELPQRRAILSQVHSDGGALPDKLQLKRAWTFDGKIDRVGIIPLGIAELNTRHAVAVDHQVDEWRIGVESLAEHDHGLAVGVPLREESGRGCDRKIAGHLSPDIVKLIRLAPDVGAGADDPVLAIGGVKLRGAFNRRSTYIVGIGEGAQLSGLSESRSGKQAREQQFS